MNDSDWKDDRASNEKPPRTIDKACVKMLKPCCGRYEKENGPTNIPAFRDRPSYETLETLFQNDGEMAATLVSIDSKRRKQHAQS